jgi:hypothetical protein
MGMVRSRKKMLEKIGGPKIVQGYFYSIDLNPSGTAKTLFDTGWVWGGESLIDIEEEVSIFDKYPLKVSRPMIQRFASILQNQNILAFMDHC